MALEFSTEFLNMDLNMTLSVLLLHQKPAVPKVVPERNWEAGYPRQGEVQDRIEQRGNKFEDPDLEVNIPSLKHN